MDDIIIFSQNTQQHVQHLNEVFATLRSAGLKVRAEKCIFGAQELEYLGHIISKDGIRVNPKKLRAITDFEQPKTLRQLRRFIGMANVHRRFIPHFSTIATPLTNLTKEPKDYSKQPGKKIRRI